jgi:hypothetical protein
MMLSFTRVDYSVTVYTRRGVQNSIVIYCVRGTRDSRRGELWSKASVSESPGVVA